MQLSPSRHLHRILAISVMAVCAFAVIVWLASEREQAAGPATSISICGSTIDVHFLGETTAITQADLMNWVHRAGDAVCTYYGKFPVAHVGLDVRIRGGAGVHGGVT